VIKISTQVEFRRRRDPGFCYLCGKAWKKGDLISADHVVPKKAIQPADRTEAFILRVHDQCHSPKKTWDERIVEVLKVLHGTHRPEKRATKLNFVVFKERNTGEQLGAVQDFDFNRIILGWLIGFHAALYREPLSHKAQWGYTLPWPTFTNPSTVDPIPPQHVPIVRAILANRKTRNLDSVFAWNKKLRYECVWTNMQGRDTCLFALDLYSWSRLSSKTGQPARSCVGFYHPTGGLPPGGSWSTRLAFPFKVQNPLDAFED